MISKFNTEKERQDSIKNSKKNYQQSDKGKLVHQKASKRYRETHPNTLPYNRKYSLKNKFNITLDDYEQMLIKQGGCCAICNISPLQLTKALAVDHCHITLKIRGLLCVNCNHALGKFKDDINILTNAIKYLELNNT